LLVRVRSHMGGVMEFHWDRRTFTLVGCLILLVAVAAVATTTAHDWGTSDKIFPVKMNGKYGFIDRHGKMAITPPFTDARVYDDGLARVQVGKAWGYIDKKGKFVAPPQFDMADPFSEGLALVGTGPKLGYINTQGKYAINPQYEGAGRFGDHRAAVLIGGR